MTDYTDEQLRYLSTSITENIFLEACPGSGKTEVVARKVTTEILNWNQSSGGMAVLSFTNSATEELNRRINKYLPGMVSSFPHFIGTFDSFIYRYIVCPLSHLLTNFQGVDGDYSLRIVETTSNLEGFRTKYSIAKKGNVRAHHFEINNRDDSITFCTGVSAVDRILNSQTLEDWQITDCKTAKSRMLSGGFATHRDIEILTLKALSQDQFKIYADLLSKRFPVVIIDECQDLSYEQLQILDIFLKLNIKLHFIGDLHQAIYGFRDVNPEDVKSFVVRNSFNTLKLTKNFRSCQKIINLCGKLTGRSEIIGVHSQLEPVCYIIEYIKCPTEVITAFQTLTDEYKNSVIVARGHSTLQKFQSTSTNVRSVHQLALSIKLYESGNMERIDQSLLLFSRFIRDYIKEGIKPNSYNCPLSVESNLQWRFFLNKTLLFLIENGAKNTHLSWTDWIKFSKQLLRNLSSQKFVSESISEAIKPLNNLNINAPKGETQNSVDTFLSDVKDTNYKYRRATIHSVKGETHDVTMLISTAKRSGDPGSHWKDWINMMEQESARFAYVASSRPKYRLIWAVKHLTKDEHTLLKNMGFTFYK